MGCSLTKLFNFERASGLLIIASILAGLIAANSPLANLYWAVHHAPVHLGIGPFELEKPLIEWINKGLMVFFFVLVGLEIKREMLEGHLATPRQAALPAIAALGGMALPAAIYVSINWGDARSIHGWAIPTATDIVLALGMLSLLGPRVPIGLRVFLTALAIFDDVGAVLIIGLFYGDGVSLLPLLAALAAFMGLLLLNAFKIMRPLMFVVLGLALWVTMLKAGVEPALAGVLIALTVPMRASGRLQSSPLRSTERRLHPWVVLIVVPVFAFLNSGIRIDSTVAALLVEPISLGIVSGLFIGKPLGVAGASYAAIRLGRGRLPDDVTWGQICGAAILAGIGFTMSLFVATLAFSEAAVVTSAKAAILIASLLSTIVGLAVVFATTNTVATVRAPTYQAH